MTDATAAVAARATGAVPASPTDPVDPVDPVDAVDRRVEQWQRERPGLDYRPVAVFARIYRLGQLIGARMERVYLGYGINRGEFDVLATLRRSGEPYTLSPRQLANALLLTSGGMTGRLDRLEHAGLVTRSPDPHDRRGLRVELTAKGRDVADRALLAGMEVQAAALASMTEADQGHLADLLRAALRGLE
jgi:DNA-binding MarR family transcriptional regulator